jgi:hypothetical protein
MAKTVSDTERMKNTPILVCAKTAFLTLTTGIMFLLITCMHFWVWGILREMGGPCVRRQPMKRSATAESLRNTGLTL